MGLGSPQTNVATCSADKTVQVVDFDQVKVHHGQVTQPGCRKTYQDVEADTTGTYYQDSPSYKVGLGLLTPGAHRPELTVTRWWRGLNCIVPRHR